ncbi:MAG: starvation-sensing protein RspA, partial [Methylocystaceae bacterium]|nr:starvation-sensing protein RspA [Methylocystaceae bacterium]
VIQEIRGPHNALLDVFPGLPELKNGFVYANEKPGLGVEFDDTLARKFPCQHGITTWTQTRLRDGSLHTP